MRDDKLILLKSKQSLHKLTSLGYRLTDTLPYIHMQWLTCTGEKSEFFFLLIEKASLEKKEKEKKKNTAINALPCLPLQVIVK